MDCIILNITQLLILPTADAFPVKVYVFGLENLGKSAHTALAVKACLLGCK